MILQNIHTQALGIMNVIVNLKLNYLTLGTTFKVVTLPTSESFVSLPQSPVPYLRVLCE